MTSLSSLELAEEFSPLAPVITALGRIKRSMGQQLLLLGYRHQQRRLSRMHLGSARAQLGKTLPQLGHHPQTSQNP